MPFSLLCYFVGVKTIILDHIRIMSKISILRQFRPWAVLSVNHITDRIPLRFPVCFLLTYSPKDLLRTDNFAGGNYQGIKTMHIADFLLSDAY